MLRTIATEKIKKRIGIDISLKQDEKNSDDKPTNEKVEAKTAESEPKAEDKKQK